MVDVFVDICLPTSSSDVIRLNIFTFISLSTRYARSIGLKTNKDLISWLLHWCQNIDYSIFQDVDTKRKNPQAFRIDNIVSDQVAPNTMVIKNTLDKRNITTIFFYIKATESVPFCNSFASIVSEFKNVQTSTCCCFGYRGRSVTWTSLETSNAIVSCWILPSFYFDLSGSRNQFLEKLKIFFLLSSHRLI